MRYTNGVTKALPETPGARSWNWRIGLPLIGLHVAALAVFLPGMFHVSAVITMLILIYLTSAIGLSLGYHRIFTHRSVRVPKAVEYVIAFLGALALEGGPISWVATHRMHHASADCEGDPHNATLGFAWSHFEWMIYRSPDKSIAAAEQARFAPDLVGNRYYRFLGRFGVPLQVALALVLLAIGGWPFVVWGVFVRLVLVFHLTWLVNSASHATGYRTYQTKDRSTNCWWVALIGWGEGWHNNHHAFPASARHGLQWYEFDLTWLTIRALALVHLARDINLPSVDALARVRLAPVRIRTR